MNKRILEIAEQAGVLADFGEDIKMGRYSIGGTNQSMEKFAELIVRECLDVCDTGYKNEFTIAGIQQCTYRMKEHFGVE